MILLTYGTRPEYLKVKPLMEEMKKRNFPFKVLFTGQHKDIAPSNADYVFEMNYVINNNRLDSIIGNILKQTDILDDPEITYVLVQGDTTSVLAIALSAYNHGKKIIHLEAGLRTYNLDHPFPEEANRQLVSRIADIHLCPTSLSSENLYNENCNGHSFSVGNTSLDNLVKYKDSCEYKDEVLVTLHRRENHHWIDKWFKKINKLAIDYPKIKFTLPIHPNPNVKRHQYLLENVNVIEPIEHDELLKLLIKCKMVITDSGGIQEECSFFNKKCLTCRMYTERPESVGLTTFLIKNPNDLIPEFNKHINKYEVNYKSPFGDGYSAKKIVDLFNKLNIIK